jgi:hypothetical protein
LEVTGSVRISGSQYSYETEVSSAGVDVVSSKVTGSYTAAFFNYTISKDGNARSGQIASVWNGSSVVYNETSTVDIGSTGGANFIVGLNGGSVELKLDSDGGWKFKTTTTLL